MSKYSTFIMGAEHFMTEPSLTDIKVTAEDKPGEFGSYKISAKFGPDTTMTEILLWLEAGAEIRVTLPDGSTGKLKLEKTAH